jgi:hypothetical protein
MTLYNSKKEMKRRVNFLYGFRVSMPSLTKQETEDIEKEMSGLLNLIKTIKNSSNEQN